MVEMGQSLGSMNKENPQGGAVAGGLIMGMLAGAYQDQARVDAFKRHEGRLAALQQSINDLLQRKEELGPVLARRYGGTFD